jgi:two-component system cell cycle sensor histidine kinase/response regulator CckA
MTNEPQSVMPEGTGHILIVDDDESVREFLQRTLLKDGHKVSVCEDGLEAIEFYEQRFADVDLIILDMIMKEMDGWLTFKELRKINPNARVIVASGYAVDSVLSQCMAAGALELLAKPFDPSQITNAVEKHLRNAGK